ncbi:MAG: chalcone isomerase family protein [Acidobacteriota bacterium]
MFKKMSLLVVMFMLILPLTGGEFKGVKMDDSFTVDGKTLLLNGMALRKKYFFKVYVAGMYLIKKESSAEKILKADEPRVTIMHFLRSVSAKKINGGWYDGLKDNTPNHSKELKSKFDTLAKYMDKMKDGERIIFTYIPEKGTDVKVKGTSKGTIKGKDFADALFACWIGEKPGPGEGFKKGLLGK